MDFTKQLRNLYSELGIKTTSKKESEITYVEPIIALSEEQEKMLLEGDGQSNPNEYKQINSSTGLAVNYYKILESTSKIENLQFEDKVAKPLNGRGGRCANLDVSYQRDGKQFYIESKFLEPYYTGNEHNSESYFLTDRYWVPEKDKDAWKKLLVDAQGFKLYNFSQLCRHLMAIWKKHQDDNTTFIDFQSVTWMMPDTFIKRIKDNETKENLIARRKGIEYEAQLCQNRINDFLKTIAWKNISFECIHYNDILSDISSSPYCSEFKKRYSL